MHKTAILKVFSEKRSSLPSHFKLLQKNVFMIIIVSFKFILINHKTQMKTDSLLLWFSISCVPMEKIFSVLRCAYDMMTNKFSNMSQPNLRFLFAVKACP